MSAEWITFSNSLAEAAANAGGHCVAVHTEARGSSSGVVWRPGVIVTAEHALRRDEDIQVTLPDGKVVSAKLVGRDASTDIAALTCSEAQSAVKLGETASLKPGHLTLVVGRTRASGHVAAFGFVSLVAEQRKMWGGTAVKPHVRLDVALQRTAVGGVVIDGTGAAVGIANSVGVRHPLLAHAAVRAGGTSRDLGHREVRHTTSLPGQPGRRAT